MESEVEQAKCESSLGNGEDARKAPDLAVLARSEREEVLRLAGAEIEILRQQVGLVQNKFYRNAWSRFLAEFGVWLRRNDEPAFLESFQLLSSSATTLEAGFWLLGGFLSFCGEDLQEASRMGIFEQLKFVHLRHSPSMQHCLKRREYRFAVSLFSEFFQRHCPGAWREWVLVELSELSGSQKLSFQQRLVLDIALYYIENVHSDRELASELILGVVNGFSSIVASDVDPCFRRSLASITRTLPTYGRELGPFVGALIRQLKRYSSRPLSQISLLESFIDGGAVEHLQMEYVLRDVISILSETISGSVGGMISSSSKGDQSSEDVQIVQSSLDVCFRLIPSTFNLEEWLEETIPVISSSKTSDQGKVSLLLVIGSISESLVRYKLEGVPVSYSLADSAQDLLLSLIDIKLPMVSSQISDHFRALAVQICSLSYVLLNGSKSHPFSDKFLARVQSLIKDQSINEACRLLVISSFVHSILLLKRLGITGNADLFDKSRVERIIISNSQVSGILGSTLNKTTNLRRLSIIVVGQIVSIQDVFGETNIFGSLDIVQSIKNSSLLLPRLGTLVDGSYVFAPSSNNNAEASILAVLIQVLFSQSSVTNFNIQFQRSQDGDSMDLKSCLLILADPNRIQSANYLISFLIQMGRVLSFLPETGDLGSVISQYSAVNMEAFQASLMLPGLKRPIASSLRAGGLQGKRQSPVSLASLTGASSLLNNRSFCQSLILAFATLLSSVNSLIRRSREQGRQGDEVCREFLLPRMDLFRVWTCLGDLEIFSKGDPSSVGYPYYVIFLLCSYHPLLYPRPSTMSSETGCFASKGRSEVVHESLIRGLVRGWCDSEEVKEAMGRVLVELYVDLTYLPPDETSGFRAAGMNLLSILKFTRDSKFTLCLLERLKLQFKDSLEFLNALPRDFGDFVVSDPGQPFEFNLHITGSQSPDQGQLFIQDLQSSISAKLKSFTGSEPRFCEFSEIYGSIASPSSWLGASLSSLNCGFSAKPGDRDPANEAFIPKSKDSEAEPDAKNASSDANSSPAKPKTSAFALAKLRKSKTDNKQKPAKPTKTPAQHANNMNARVHANSNAVGSLSTCSSSVGGVNNGSVGNNLTKEDILRQRLAEQNNLRRDAERVISSIRSDVDVIVEALMSWVSGVEDESEEVFMIDLEMSEVLYLVCGRMLEFKPLRHCGLCVLERLFGRLVLRNNRLGRSMVDYLSRQDEESRDVCLQEILDSVHFGRPGSAQFYLRNSSGASVLVYIISKVLYDNCGERSPKSDKQIQITSQLIQYLSGSMRHGGLRVSLVHLSNMLYLYVLALGDLVELDQYLHPLRMAMMELRPTSAAEVDLVSSLLVFANPRVRLIALDSLRRALDGLGVEMGYFTFMNLSIAREVQVFGGGSSAEDLASISDASEGLIERYKERMRREGGSLEEQGERLVDDLVEILVVPVVSTLQQRNLSRSISRVSSDGRHCSSTVKKVMERSARVFSGFEKRRVFTAQDWPGTLTRSLISGMVPDTIRHLDSVLPRFVESESEKMVSRIQARHALKGLIFVLSDMAVDLDGLDSVQIEVCIRFVLTQVVDSVVFEDYVSEGERMAAASSGGGDGGDGFKGRDKKGVKNFVGSFASRQDSPEKTRIRGYDLASREDLQKAVVDFFVSLSSRPDIQDLSSGILIKLRDLSSQYKPRINPREFHNCLAFAIGSIASCCSSSDQVVYKVTGKIMNELLSGSLVRKDGRSDPSESALKAARLPELTDIPQEYSRILPRLFGMLYDDRGCGEEDGRITRFEALDKSRYLRYRMDSEDSFCGERLSVYELYSISLCKALFSESPEEQIGAAHIFGSLSKGITARRLRDFGILEAIEDALKSHDCQRGGETGSLEGLLLCIGSLSLYLEYIIEPYTIQFLKSLMHLFSGGDQRIRFYSEKSAEIIIKNLSRYGARLILPIITEGIEEKQWRIKLTSLQLLGIMALNSPHQLSSYLPRAIQTIYQATSDSHPKVSEAARETLFKMVSLIKNPEVSCISQDLTASLIDPTELNFKRALLSLKSVTFVHAVDITTLSLIFPVLLKTIQERGGTDLKKDAIQILTSLLLLLSDKTDLDPFLPLIENSIHITLTDPIPEIRLLTAKLCRALVTVTGQEKASSLLGWLFRTLAMEVGQTLKSGVSASLAEVLSAFGIERFRKILPSIISQIQKVEGDHQPVLSGENRQEQAISWDSAAASIREGYIGLFVYLPQSFGEDLGPLMPEILPVLLSRLGDESDSVREVSIKACKALVVQFGSDHAAYILQPLEEGLGNDNWRVRLSSCSLLGTLLNRLVKGQLDASGHALSTNSSALGEAGFSMQRRSYILAAIYMARNDVNISVKNSATALWKSLVQNTPQTLKDILTILIRRIINALSTSSSSSGNIHYMAVQCLKDLLDKFGSTLHNKLLPIFYQNLGGLLNDDGTMSLDSGGGEKVCTSGEVVLPNRLVRIGSCIGVLEILRAMRRGEVKGLASTFLPVIRLGLCDQDLEVRTHSVECLDIFAGESAETLFSVIDWLMDGILAVDEEGGGEGLEQDDPRISTIELIIQLPHSGIVSSILPRVISGTMTMSKIRMIRSMSKIPSQSRLRSSLFDIVPRLIETSIDFEGRYDKLIRDSSKEAMMSIVQSLETQSMETFATILLEVIRENTPSTNLSISGRYQIESLNIGELSELVKERETLMRIKAIEFLTLSLFPSSPVYETCFSLLVKYLIPLSMCDVSETVRVSASGAFNLFSASVPRKSVVQVCSVMRESVGALVHDPIDNQKHFTDNNKFIGYSWKVSDGKVVHKFVIDATDVGCQQLISSSNKLIDSMSALYLQGISQGSPDSKEECAVALGEVIQLTSSESLRPIAVKLVGPLIRSISDRTTTSLVRGALLSNLVIFLESCGLQLRPLLPQIQTILIKFLLDPNENVRRQCSRGIGFLSRLLGNRAEVLLNDLCSLASKQSQSEESMNALLSSINLSLLSSGCLETEEKGLSRPVISEMLRNKLIGMSLSLLEESKDPAIKDVSGQILSSVLINYCQEEEIREILLPLLLADGQSGGNQLNNDRNLMNIFNSCSESCTDGWGRLYSSLGDLEGVIVSRRGEREYGGGAGGAQTRGEEDVQVYLDLESKEVMFGGRRLPRDVLESRSWWIYKKTLVLLYKVLLGEDGKGVQGTSSGYSSQLKKLSLSFLGNLTRTAVENRDRFTASIVLQVLAMMFEKDVLTLFPTFSDTCLILEIQKICEMMIESESSRELFQSEIQSNLVCYSFGAFAGGSFGSGLASQAVSSQDILVSLVSMPSIQSLSSKFPAVKLKAEQFLVSLIKLVTSLRRAGSLGGYQGKSVGVEESESLSFFELVISDMIQVIEKMYPGHLSQQKASFTMEYSRRVLSKAS